MKRRRILVTGGAGFVGHHFVEHVFKNTEDWEIVVLDRLSYAGSLERIKDIDVFDEMHRAGRIHFVFHDLRAAIVGNDVLEAKIGPLDYIVHMAAETHVDRSIEDPRTFVDSNVIGTLNVLEFARTQKRLRRMVVVSTDEVYGPAPQGVFWKEWDRTKPSNPYAATKAAGDALALAYARTYGLPVFITRTMNIIGERQHQEKMVMKTMRALMDGKRVVIHGNRKQIGSRCWLHARNQADAILFLLRHGRGKPGEIYNIAGAELNNLEIAQLVAEAMGAPLRYQLRNFHNARPGHDERYALSSQRIHEMGWQPPIPLETSLRRTVQWMMQRPEWLGLAPQTS